MTRRILNTRMQKLFELLRQTEERQLKLSARDLEQMVIAQASYKSETWTTYRSKYLDNALVFSDDDDPVLLRVRGAVAMAPERFAQLMTQTKVRASAGQADTEESWREQLRTLAALGRERKFMLPSEDRPLILGLFDKQRSLF